MGWERSRWAGSAERDVIQGGQGLGVRKGAIQEGSGGGLAEGDAF